MKCKNCGCPILIFGKKQYIHTAGVRFCHNVTESRYYGVYINHFVAEKPYMFNDYIILL